MLKQDNPDAGSAAARAAAALAASGRTLASAESCTGGLIAKRITDLPGVSAFYLGGAVTYANSAKVALLGVSPATLAAHGAVSPEVACEMAAGARRALGADMAVSTTGVAGPGGGTPKKPVGLVYVGFADETGARAYRYLYTGSPVTRAAVRGGAADFALGLLCGAPADPVLTQKI